MNFDAASEMAIEDDDIQVEKVYVNDDIAVEDNAKNAGRRGVAGTIFVHKIAGASAERGDDLKTVKAMAEKTIKNVKSIGFALTSCTVPAKGTPTFAIGEDEIEYGVGIHGELGIERRKMASSKELVDDMMTRLTKELELKENDEIAVMVNGLGATPIQELYIVNKDVHDYCEKNKLKVYKNFVGNQKRGGAKLGDKTLLDALIPAHEAMKNSEYKDLIEMLKDAAKAAREGAEKTKEIVASKGRASYVGERSVNHPDAGAMAIAIIFETALGM